MVNKDVKVNVTPRGGTQIISPATAGIQGSAVEQIAGTHTLDKKGKQLSTRVSKKPKNYEPNYNKKTRTAQSTSTWT